MPLMRLTLPVWMSALRTRDAPRTDLASRTQGVERMSGMLRFFLFLCNRHREVLRPEVGSFRDPRSLQ